jgi:multidrug efflux pump subunit AcrB
MLAFLLSFVFMYIVLAAQFESFVHPVTILLTLPLSIPFAIFTTADRRPNRHIFSDSDYLFGSSRKTRFCRSTIRNGLRERGMNRYDAIIQANRDRLRPILMTTIALVAGMIPLSFERRGRGHEPLDRRARRRRSIALSASDLLACRFSTRLRRRADRMSGGRERDSWIAKD